MRTAGLLAVLIAALSVPAAWAGGMDGTRWRMRKTGFLQLFFFWETDILTFKDGTFRSSESASEGFKPVPYAGDQAWSAVQTNGLGERLEWQGTRSGAVMKGVLTRTDLDGDKTTRRWKAKFRR